MFDTLVLHKTYNVVAQDTLQFFEAHYAAHKGKLVQVCGPISASENQTEKENIAQLRLTIRILSQKYVVFNQLSAHAALQKIAVQRKRCNFFIDYDWAILEEYFLPIMQSGWFGTFIFSPQKSKGTAWEEKTAPQCGIERKYLAEDWLTIYRQTGKISFITPQL